MKMRKFIASAIAICAVFAFTSFAFAANHVTLKTTVPNLPKSVCDQAGTITMEMDGGTVIEEGDVIQFTLNNNVTVCKAIDFFVAMADDGTDTISTTTSNPVSAPAGTLSIAGANVNNTAAAAVAGIAAGGTGNLTIDGSAAVVGFRVTSPVGSSIVTLTLGYLNMDPAVDGVFTTRNDANDFTMSVGGLAADQRLSVKLFDGKINPAYLRQFDTAPTSPVDPTGSYNDLTLDVEDNAICINTSLLTTEFVYATPDSIVGNVAYKLGFSGDYTVAHVAASDSYIMQAVCKDACPTVVIGETVDQFGVKTKPGSTFDSSNYSVAAAGAGLTADRWTSTGTCDASLGNGLILRRSGQNFTPNQKFSVQLELLIDGVAANKDAVSFTAGFAATNAYYVSSSDVGRCSANATAMTAGTAPGWAVVTAGDNSKIKATLTASSAHDAFVLDIPAITFDYTKLVAGAKLEVKVSFGKSPCGGSESANFCLATFVSKCDTAGAYTLLYPFATGSGNATFWSGVVVTNTASATATATVALFDTAGGSGSLAVSIDAKGQFVKTVGQIVADAAFKSGTKALDATKDVQISVTADQAVDGLIFVGADGVMHGYLPRVFKGAGVQH